MSAIGFLEHNRFDWNDCYLATTTPGHSYSGVLDGPSGTLAEVNIKIVPHDMGRYVLPTPNRWTEGAGGDELGSASGPNRTLTDPSTNAAKRDSIALLVRKRIAAPYAEM